MSEPAEIVAVVGQLQSTRGNLYELTLTQETALKDLGVRLVPVRPERVVETVIEDLSDAGYRLFRPDDCDTVTVEDQGTSKHDGYVEGWYPAGTYWLVEKEDNE